MSDDKVSLEFLGEQMLRMHADMRDVRAGYGRMNEEQSDMRGDLRRLEATVDAHDRSNQARFDQVNKTAATNLALTLSAIEKLASTTNARFAQVEQTAAENLQTLLKAIDQSRS